MKFLPLLTPSFINAPIVKSTTIPNCWQGKIQEKKKRKENIDRTINEKKKKIKLWQYVTG